MCVYIIGEYLLYVKKKKKSRFLRENYMFFFLYIRDIIGLIEPGS